MVIKIEELTSKQNSFILPKARLKTFFQTTETSFIMIMKCGDIQMVYWSIIRS